jgi:hypothetical protein
MKRLGGTPSPLMESHEAYHVSLRGRRLLVVGRRHPPLRLGPARPWLQKSIVDQLLQLPLHHQGMSPHVRGKDLALAHHGCRKTACGGGRGRSNDGGGWRLKGAQRAKRAETQMACRGNTEPRASHLYPDGRPTGGQKGRNNFRIQ